MTKPILYKVLPHSTWETAKSEGVFRGSGIDLTDGFIHLSTDQQVVETVAKHFVGQSGLVLIAIDGQPLGETLRWEVSRGGDLFPHVYGNIPTSAATSVEPLPMADDGTHQFPERFS